MKLLNATVGVAVSNPESADRGSEGHYTTESAYCNNNSHAKVLLNQIEFHRKGVVQSRVCSAA